MPDTKISALSAVTAVAATDEFAVNEAGTSKKASATQLKEFLNYSMLGMIEATARGYNMP